MNRFRQKMSRLVLSTTLALAAFGIAAGSATSLAQDKDIDELRARLKQLEAENAKLRDALQVKESEQVQKKIPVDKFDEKSPPKKSALHGEAEAKKIAGKHEVTYDLAVARLKSLHESLAKLQKEGRQDEAEKLAREIEDWKAHLHKSLAELEPVKPGAKDKLVKHESPEIAERIELLKREIDENQRAGRKEQAEALRHELEKNIEHMEQLRRKGFAKHEPASAHELGAMVHELREEVQRLRAEVGELRNLLKGSKR